MASMRSAGSDTDAFPGDCDKRTKNQVHYLAVFALASPRIFHVIIKLLFTVLSHMNVIAGICPYVTQTHAHTHTQTDP